MSDANRTKAELLDEVHRLRAEVERLRAGRAPAETAEDKTIRQALEASEARYRRMVEMAYEGVVELDAEGRITFVNDRLSELLGYEPKELIGRFAWDFMEQEQAKEVQEHLAQRREGLREHYDVTILDKAGRHVSFIASSTPLHDSGGRFVGSLSMLTDVTERRQIEESLHETEEVFAAFMEQLPATAFIKDQDSRLRYFNRQMQEKRGVEESWKGKRNRSALRQVGEPRKAWGRRSDGRLGPAG